MNGWTILAHPLFLDQLENLVDAVERERESRPGERADSANAKVLKAISDLAFDEIPTNPLSSEYRQGRTLGGEYKNWSRAKFGAGRFRLFFRFRTDAKIIVFAWVNDQDTLRERGAKSDAYATFRRMLEAGNPPDDWATLLAAASEANASARIRTAAKQLKPNEPRRVAD